MPRDADSGSEPVLHSTFITPFNSNTTTPQNPIKQKFLDDFVLDIHDINKCIFGCYFKSIDSLAFRVFKPNPGYKIAAVKDGDHLILDGRFGEIKCAIVIRNFECPPILCAILPNEDKYFFKDCGRWREVDRSEYIHLLKKVRSIIFIKEISIDTSNLINIEGLLSGGVKYGSTYQFSYIPHSGYVVRIVQYGDDVIWKARDETQRCMAAFIFLNNYEPVGMTALIFADKLQIVYYKFENDRWTNIDEDDYMRMVASYKPPSGDFIIHDHKRNYDLMKHLCPQ